MRVVRLFVLLAIVCMWSATLLLMAMFFLRTSEWVEEAMVLAYLGYASVVGASAIGIVNEVKKS